MPSVPTNFAYLPSDPPRKETSSLVRFAKSVLRAWELLSTVVNGQISFGNGTTPDNINGVWVKFATAGPANTNFTVTHNLGRVPVGWLQVSVDAFDFLILGTVAATTTQITFKSANPPANFIIFVF